MIYNGKATNPELLKRFCDDKTKRECYSGCMTPNEAVQWWMKEDSIKWSNDNSRQIRYAASQYLLHDRTQSGVERTFAKYKRYACPTRNQMNSETAFNDVLVAACKKHNEVFHILRTGLSEKESSKKNKKNETKEERDLRHGY